MGEELEGGSGEGMVVRGGGGGGRKWRACRERNGESGRDMEEGEGD